MRASHVPIVIALLGLDPTVLSAGVGGSRSLVIAAVVGVGTIVLLVLVALIARIGAFSRRVDQRSVRRAKFQDEWSSVIRAADEAYHTRDRKPK